MKDIKKIFDFKDNKKMTAAVTVCGVGGLLLIMLSSLLPDKEDTEKNMPEKTSMSANVSEYCSDTEKRLERFLSSIEGAGEVEVYLTVGSSERFVYATEGRHSETENRTEEEEKYVMTGSGSDKTALIETVRIPDISGAVIVCSGGGSPAVQERMYKAASAALAIPTSKIYVTKLG